MSLNIKQKKVLLIWLLLSLAALIIWFAFGGEVFTKTKVLVEKQDDFLGTTYKEWEDKFILGLDYTLGFIGILFVITTSLLWKMRTKKLN